MTPLDMYLSQASSVRMVEDPASLDVLFLKRVQSKVKHDGTVSIMGRLFELPPQFIGQRVEPRYDDTGIYVYDNGVQVATAVPVNFADNARVKRALSFREMSTVKEES